MNLSKMMLEVEKNSDLVYPYLGISLNNKGLKKRYRKPFRFEAYSVIAQYRLLWRIRGARLTNYGYRVKELICKMWIFTECRDLIIQLNDEQLVDELKLGYDIVGIRKNCDIQYTSDGNTIFICSDSIDKIARFAAFFVCDLIDLDVPFSMAGNVEVYNRILLLLSNKISFSIDSYSLITSNQVTSKLMDLCGFRLIGEESIIPEPYRADVSMASEVLADLVDFTFRWPSVYSKTRNINLICFERLGKIQDFLLHYEFNEISIEKSYNRHQFYTKDEIVEFVLFIEKKSRSIKQPHRFYCIVNSHDVNHKILIWWVTGNNIDLNYYAHIIRMATILVFGKDVKWEQLGEKLRADLLSKPLAQTWVVNDRQEDIEQFHLGRLIIGTLSI